MSGIDYDVIIIGSGFGGSVAALRAVEKGYSVGVLEAGRRHADADLPKSSWEFGRYQWQPELEPFGIQRIRCLEGVIVLSRLPARRQPGLSIAGGRGQCRRFDDGVLRTAAAGRRPARQRDPDRARQGLVRDPAPVRPAGTLLHEGVASRGDRAGQVDANHRQKRPKETPMRIMPPPGRWLAAAALALAAAAPALAQEVLPFPPKPSVSIALPTIQDSVYSPLPAESLLPKDAPNILIELIDDVGPAQADTCGGLIQTPTLSNKKRETR